MAIGPTIRACFDTYRFADHQKPVAARLHRVITACLRCAREPLSALKTAGAAKRASPQGAPCGASLSFIHRGRQQAGHASHSLRSACATIGAFPLVRVLEAFDAAPGPVFRGHVSPCHKGKTPCVGVTCSHPMGRIT
jgi:hypothetical protein